MVQKGCGGHVVGRWALSRRDQGSKPPPPFRRLGNFVHSTLPVSFKRDSKTFSHFYLMSVPGEVKDFTQGNG